MLGKSFAIARDVVTDRIFIVRSKGVSRPELSYDEDKINIRGFLAIDGAEQNALLDLIGTLVREE